MAKAKGTKLAEVLDAVEKVLEFMKANDGESPVDFKVVGIEVEETTLDELLEGAGGVVKIQPEWEINGKKWWGVVVNYHIWEAVIHSSESVHLQKAVQGAKARIGNAVFTNSENSFWVMPFKSFSTAFTFATLLKCRLSTCLKEFRVSTGKGIKGTYGFC